MRDQGRCFLIRLSKYSGGTVFEPQAVITGFENVAMMGGAIDERGPRPQRQTAELVEDDEVRADQAFGDLIRSTEPLLLVERVGKLDAEEQPDLLAQVRDGVDDDSSGDVGLTGAGLADQDVVAGTVDEVAAVQLTDLGGPRRCGLTMHQTEPLSLRVASALRLRC